MVTRLEDCRFLVRSLAQQEQGGQGFRNLDDHVVHQIGVLSDVGEFGLLVEQARTDHDRQQHFADFFFGAFEPGVFAQEDTFHETDAPAAQVRIIRVVAQIQITWQFEFFVRRQLTRNVRLQQHQRGFDLFALCITGVMRRLGEQGVDPLALRHRLGTDRQRGQVAVGGHIVQCFFVQFICIEEDLQAGKLLSEGHGRTTLEINDAEF